jgi:hypothetical protein
MTRCSVRSHVWTVLFACLALLAPAAPARAQAPREPPGPFAADFRVALPGYSDDSTIASALGVTADNLPGRGLGLAGGANWYPLRRKVTFGIGVEVLVSRGSQTLEPEEEGGIPGPTVNTRFSVFSPQASINFGSNRGWSYLSGGLGWGRFTSEREDDPVGDADGRPRVLNYGGGARWFAKDHLAFALDLRFYTVAAQEATATRPPYPKMRMMVFSAGVGFK